MSDAKSTFDQMGLEEEELILRAKEGNVGAFEQLVQRYDKKVFSIASMYVQSAEDAKDIYQEVFVRVYKGIPNFAFRSEFSTWLYRITTNVCLSYKARQKKHGHSSLDEGHDSDESPGGGTYNAAKDDASTDQGVINAEISERVEAALGSLSPKQKMVFTLRHYQGHKLKEIASIMKCKEGTVKKYLFTATEKMRVELKELME